MEKKTSIGSWAYVLGRYEKNPIPLNTVVEKLSELGFDGIELSASPPHFEYNTREERKEIKKLLNKNGLKVSGLAAPFPSPATSRIDKYLNAVKANLEICNDIGIPKLKVHSVDTPDCIPGCMDYDTYFSKIAEVWNKSAEICMKNDVKLIWEFEPGFMVNKPSEIVRLVYKIDHPNFFILFDFSHAYMCAVAGSRQLGSKETLPGGIVQLAHMLTGKIGHMHLTDSDGTLYDNDSSKHVPIGMGLLDFDKIIPAVLEAGYDDEWWVIDLCFWPEAFDATENSKKYLDKLIKKYG